MNLTIVSTQWLTSAGVGKYTRLLFGDDGVLSFQCLHGDALKDLEDETIRLHIYATVKSYIDVTSEKGLYTKYIQNNDILTC